MTAARRATVRALVFAPLLLVHPVVAAAPQPSPPARTVLLRVVDRLGRPVPDASACLLPACARVDLRAAEGGITATLQASDAPVRLRVSARGFDPAELTVGPSPATPAAEPAAPAPPTDVTLKAKGSVRLALLSFDEKRPLHASVSLKETVDP